MYVRTENVMETRDICITSGAQPVKPPNLNCHQNIVNHVIQCYSIASLFFPDFALSKFWSHGISIGFDVNLGSKKDLAVHST